MNHGVLDLGGRNNNHRKKINTDTCTNSVSYSDRILNDGTPRVDIAKKVVSPSVVEETVVKEKLSHVVNTTVLGSKQQLPMQDSTSASNASGKSLYANVTGTGEMKNLKKTSQTPNGFPVDQKMEFKSIKQVYQRVSKKPTANTSVNKKKNVDSAKEVSIQATNSSGSSFWNVDASSPSTTLVIEKIDKIEKLIIEGEVTLMDDEGKPFEKSLLEQWTESYENGDYGYEPYDDDMYEGQDIPEKLQAICDILDIAVRGRRKK
uniref:Uncharacterized protein n=1 Tax=Tanacetum cinerariifolium TaxID=118510 RepID=A0A699IKD8_TANCI|nr:hypothetical protein [Tanacetum cinerariifolium]